MADSQNTTSTTVVPAAKRPRRSLWPFAGRWKDPHDIERIIIRTYPKVIFLYPSMIFAFICAFFVSFDWGNPANWGISFMLVLTFNLFVLAFDFPRTASLTLVFSVVAVILAAVLLNQKTEFFPFLSDQTGKLNPVMNGTFYWIYALVLLVIFTVVWILHRFVDYWEVLSNELIHHHGILGGIQRLPAPGIKLEKEITDVFEYLLMQSGRLVITPQGDSRAIILDNVPNINRVEDGVKAILGVTEVSFRQRDSTLTHN